MSRFYKKREEDLLRKLQEREEVDMTDIVDIPDYDTKDLIEEHSSSIIVRILNVDVLKPVGALEALPIIWEVEGRVRGRGVGNNRVQFIFDKEEDLVAVLRKAPWFVNGWMLTGQRWTPKPPQNFLTTIPFWIRIKGIPTHQLKEEAVFSIGSKLGKVESVELHAKNSTSLDYVRARVWIPVEEPIVFKKAAKFKSGEVVIVELQYEKLTKLCYRCKRLTHDQYHCRDKNVSIPHPAQAVSSDPIPKKKTKAGKQSVVLSEEKEGFVFSASSVGRAEDNGQGRGGGRGRGGRGRGRGRGKGRSSAASTSEGCLDNEALPESSVFQRLSDPRGKIKSIAKEPEWRQKEVGRAPTGYSEQDDRVGKKLGAVPKDSSAGMDGSGGKAGVRSKHHDVDLNDSHPDVARYAEQPPSSSMKKRKPSVERNRAKKKAKLVLTEESPLNNHRLQSEGSSNSEPVAGLTQSSSVSTPFTLSSGVKVSVNPRTPKVHRFVVNRKPPASI